MEVYIREIEEKDYLALLSIMNSEIGSRYATVVEKTNICQQKNLQFRR